MIFQIHDGRVKVGETIMSVAEYQAIRPDQPLPGLPAGIVTARYDASTGAVTMSDGRTQQAGVFDTVRADTILADATLAQDLADHRDSQEEV